MVDIVGYYAVTVSHYHSIIYNVSHCWDFGVLCCHRNSVAQFYVLIVTHDQDCRVLCYRSITLSQYHIFWIQIVPCCHSITLSRYYMLMVSHYRNFRVLCCHSITWWQCYPDSDLHNITLAWCHTTGISRYCVVTVPHCHNIRHWWYHTVRIPGYYAITLSHCHNINLHGITLLVFHSDVCHSATLSQYHIVIVSQCRDFRIWCCNTITMSQ